MDDKIRGKTVSEISNELRSHYEISDLQADIVDDAIRGEFDIRGRHSVTFAQLQGLVTTILLDAVHFKIRTLATEHCEANDECWHHINTRLTEIIDEHGAETIPLRRWEHLAEHYAEDFFNR